MEFTCNKNHYYKEFNLKGQCTGIVYLSEAIKVHYVIKQTKLFNNIRVIIMMCGKE